MDVKLMPTRDDALQAQGNDEVCDLDVILSRRATFTFRGKVHEILPITTERLFSFWSAAQEVQKVKYDTAEQANKAFYKLTKTICNSLTLKDASLMSVVQKANLLEHVTRKIMGQTPLVDALKKKVMLPQSA